MEVTFGLYIRELRINRCLTLTQLAAQLDLDSANLSKIENGKREFDEKRLWKLAKVFQIDLSAVKMEFYSDLFAKKIFENDCSIEALRKAEEKVAYLINKNVKQTQIRFDKE